VTWRCSFSQELNIPSQSRDWDSQKGFFSSWLDWEEWRKSWRPTMH
jgi:hypothetical protein